KGVAPAVVTRAQKGTSAPRLDVGRLAAARGGGRGRGLLREERAAYAGTGRHRVRAAGSEGLDDVTQLGHSRALRWLALLRQRLRLDVQGSRGHREGDTDLARHPPDVEQRLVP